MPDAMNFYGTRMWRHWTFRSVTRALASLPAP